MEGVSFQIGNNDGLKDLLNSSKRRKRDVPPGGGYGAPSGGVGGGVEGGGTGTEGGPGGISTLQSQNLPPKSDGRAPRQDYETRMKFLKMISEMSLEEKEPLGHQIDDFILDCEYAGYECLAR